jgi:hypothetical protein
VTGDQWFQLWIAIGQVGGGLIAVLVAARLAFAFAQRQRTEDRSRVAAEKLAFALHSSAEHLILFYGTIKFVIQPPPKSLHEAIAENADPAEVADVAESTFLAIRNEAALLSSNELQNRVQWATMALIDFKLMVHAAKMNPKRFSIIELADTAGEAYSCLKTVQVSLERYARGELLQSMDKPTYWRSPVDQSLDKVVGSAIGP